MASIQVVESDSIEDIDEALTHVCVALKSCVNRDLFLSIADDLLDERLNKSCAS